MAERGDEFFGLALLQLDPGPRMAFDERGQGGGHQPYIGRGKAAQPQPAGGAGGELLDVVVQVLHGRQHMGTEIDQAVGRGGGADPVRLPLEEHQAGLLLQRGDLLRDGGGGVTEVAGREGERGAADDGLEGEQMQWLQQRGLPTTREASIGIDRPRTRASAFLALKHEFFRPAGPCPRPRAPHIVDGARRNTTGEHEGASRVTSTDRGVDSLDAAAVAEALDHGDCGRVAGDAGHRAQYASDASNYRQIPLAVVFPRERQHVLNALRVCRRLGVPVTARGAGTSTSGQASDPVWCSTSPATSTG